MTIQPEGRCRRPWDSDQVRSRTAGSVWLVRRATEAPADQRLVPHLHHRRITRLRLGDPSDGTVHRAQLAQWRASATRSGDRRDTAGRGRPDGGGHRIEMGREAQAQSPAPQTPQAQATSAPQPPCPESVFVGKGS